VNNERQSQNGVRAQFADLWNTNLDLSVFAGTGNDYNFNWGAGPRVPVSGADGYLSAALHYSQPTWRVGGTYLIDGWREEQGWSADAWAKISGNGWGGTRELLVEYAQQTRTWDGWSLSDQAFETPEAIMAMLDLWRGSKWALRGYFSSVGGGYNPYFSRVNPYFENLNRNEHNWGAVPWERFLRNPLAINNVKVYGAKVDFYLGSMPFEVAYYGLEDCNDNSWNNSPWKFAADQGARSEVPVDTIISLHTKTDVAPGVTVGFTAAYQGYNDSWRGGLDDETLVSGDVTVSF